MSYKTNTDKANMTIDIDHLLNEVKVAVESPVNQSHKDISNQELLVGLENVAWTEIFGFDMNQYYQDPLLHLEIQLRQKLYYWEHFQDDRFMTEDISVSVGYYFEYTLFGMSVIHQPNGVPIIQNNSEFAKTRNLRLLKPHNFHTSGQMPQLLSLYEGVSKICDGRIPVGISSWMRGGLDIAIELLGYENFVQETVEHPQFIHDLMRIITDERIKWFEEYHWFLGSKPCPTMIADDWLNAPFITPDMFSEFVLPYYLKLESYHGGISYLHSCGNQAPFHHDLLKLKTLGCFEINQWMNLEESLRNIPLEKFLHIQIKNVNVLLNTEEELIANVRNIVNSCRSRRYIIVADGLQRLHDNFNDDLLRIKNFIRLAREVLVERRKDDTR